MEPKQPTCSPEVYTFYLIQTAVMYKQITFFIFQVNAVVGDLTRLFSLIIITPFRDFLFFVLLLFYVHGKHLRSCRDGQFT